MTNGRTNKEEFDMWASQGSANLGLGSMFFLPFYDASGGGVVTQVAFNGSHPTLNTPLHLWFLDSSSPADSFVNGLAPGSSSLISMGDYDPGEYLLELPIFFYSTTISSNLFFVTSQYFSSNSIP